MNKNGTKLDRDD